MSLQLLKILKIIDVGVVLTLRKCKLFLDSDQFNFKNIVALAVNNEKDC